MSSLDPKILKLTKMDDEIYEKFRSDFPDIKVDHINADEIKSKENKEVCYKDRIDTSIWCSVNRISETLRFDVLITPILLITVYFRFSIHFQHYFPITMKV